MYTNTLSRRELLGTTARGVAAFATLSASAALSSKLALATGAETCIANHKQLAQNLRTLMDDPSVGEVEAAHAQKTCRCIHCDVAIAPMLTI